MALDEALMEAIRQGTPPVLRFYRWAPPCLSLGRNQPAKDRYDQEALRRRGIEVVRRPTGGRAVLHHRELTYSVVVREGVLGSPRECYAAINRALVAGLRRLGVAAALQPRTTVRAPVPSLVPCFREPAEGEVVVEGRKLIGSAQYREAGVVLQHGSLLLDGNQREVREFVVGSPSPGPSAPPLLRRPAEGQRGGGAEERWIGGEGSPATLRDFCDPLPSWEALTAALRAGWEDEMGIGLEAAEPTAAELRCAEQLAARYVSAAWTWRL